MTTRNGEGPLLRLTEHAGATPGKYSVEVVLEGAGVRTAVTSSFELAISAQDREDVRWYLEDYLLFPLDPAPEIAARVEKRMAALGEALFEGVFSANKDATKLWYRISDRLAETRVEVITEARHAASVPWELMRDPEAATPLALEAHAFVRGHGGPVKTARSVEEAAAGPIRILLVICRPRGGKDVPFRSVARKLLEGLDKAAREVVSLDVLRPPTFEMLARTLREAKERGEPYHVVHFDGHGAYTDDPEAGGAEVPAGAGAHVYEAARTGAHGYLVFESVEEARRERGDFIDGPKLGKLLYETGVPVLVLNACRSAHADPPEKPEEAGAENDAHEQVASFGSLALEVMDKGVSGVVAMRYNVYVVTAAQFVADLYGALAGGLALGEAVTRGRKQLHDQPLRTIAYEGRKLEDWPVPIVYEADRVPLFPAPVSSRGIKLTLGKGEAGGDRGAMVGVPAAPDAGFFGRDETLLALDRAFDKQRVVLLHAYAGSGKSSAAAEFARWYSRTGGVERAVWTNFERRLPLPQALDQLARHFERDIEQLGKPWLALSDAERREVALQILEQREVLWVWDNVEPVAGFPTGTASAWMPEEQGELVDFLREARGTKAKFLLTSRREEQAWLGDLPARIAVPPMPMQERVQLARALAEKRGARLDAVGYWRPLLAFTQGNPMAITVLVGQALRDGVRTKEQVEAFVKKLEAGENAFTDEATEGRSRSLGASLSYGFEHAFGDDERKQVALLYLFQGFVDVRVLCAMGTPRADCCVPEVHGLTWEAGLSLLDRAAEIGLLMALGGGYYAIHPAVPWFLRGLFEQYYHTLGAIERPETPLLRVSRAYAEAMSAAGNHHIKAYADGDTNVVMLVRAEEANLLRAREIARAQGWWTAVIGTMQGLRTMHEHAGMTPEWSRLVNELVPDLVDPETQGPLPGMEKEEPWLMLTGYRATVARRERRLNEVEHLQRIRTDWCRMRAASALAAHGHLDAVQSNLIHSLIVALEQLGSAQRERGIAQCLETFGEALELAHRFDNRGQQASTLANIGYAYVEVPELHNFDMAEQSFVRGLDLLGEEAPHLSAKILGALGQTVLQRGLSAHNSGRPKQEVLLHMNTALTYLQRSLKLLPDNAMGDRATVHQVAGFIFGHSPDMESARTHINESICYFEGAGDLYAAASTRAGFASGLRAAGRLSDARAYALAALRNFETYGDRAADEIQKTRSLLADIDRDLAKSQSP